MAAPGSFAGSGAGLPGVGQFRLDIGVGLDGYPGLEDAYRQSPNASFGRMPMQNQQHSAPQGATAQQNAGGAGAPVGGGGQFGILAPTTMPSGMLESHLDATRQVSFTMDGQNPVVQESMLPGDKSHGKLPGKIVVDPPDLQTWREKLFNVDDLMVLTDEQYVLVFSSFMLIFIWMPVRLLKISYLTDKPSKH